MERLFWRRQNRSCLSGVILAICLIGAHYSAFGVAGYKTGYKVDSSKSYLVAITGKSGLFSFAGHEHAILATKWTVEESLDPSNLKASAVSIKIPAASLVIDSAEARKIAGLGSGPGADDVRKIQERMLGPSVLDAQNYPSITFTTKSVEVMSGSELRMTGQFQLHGQTHELRVPLRYAWTRDGELDVSGQFTVKQTDFGIMPESVAVGAVKVKDEVRIRFQVSMTPTT
jgi:polyisoprenoid-binding protein YceI